MPDPLWLNTLTYDAHELRVGDALMFMTDGTGRGARGGVRPGSGLTLSVSGTTITLTSGNAVVPAPVGEGVYRVALDSNWTQTYNAADATFTRIDLVYLRVWDQDLDGTGLRQASPVYLAGTPSGTPVAPSIPTGQYAIPLGTVTVPPSGGGAATASTALRQYTVGAGGILPGQTSGNPAGTYTGMYWDDGTNLRRYNGSGVDTIQKVTTTGWTQPTLATGYAHDGDSNGFVQYRKITVEGTAFVEWRGGLAITYLSNALQNGGNPLSALLTSAYWPSSIRTLVVPCSGTNSSSSCVKVNFAPDGSVQILGTTTAATDTYATPVVRPPWLTLNGIRYSL